MSLLETLFQAAYDRLNPDKMKELPLSAAVFSSFQERLTYLSASLSPLKLNLNGSLGGSGGEWRLHGKCLLFPSFVNVFPSSLENFEVYKFRLIVEFLGLEYSLRGQTLPEEYTFFEAKNGHLSDLITETPFGSFISGVAASLQEKTHNAERPSGHAKAMLHFYAPSKHDLQAIALDQDASSHKNEDAAENTEAVLLKHANPKNLRQVSLSEEDMNPLVHTFEKIHTLDDYTGGNKQIDDADDMKNNSRALEDVDFNTVIRTNKRGSGSIEGPAIQIAEFEPTSIRVLSPKQFYYSEWDTRKGLYRADWCVVRESLLNHKASLNPHNTLDGKALDSDEGEYFDHCRAKGRSLRARLAQFYNTYQWNRRQQDGPELDLGAFIDSRVEQKRGGQPSDEIYLSRVRTNLNFALTVLCDSSLSTDSWIDGKQVYKIVHDAAVILSYGLQDVGCQWSVAAFNSYTRHDCQYRVIKDFEDSSDIVRNSIGAIKPDGYTRIGPAMRHAGSRLSQLRAKRNMLIVITDAKPSDYDHYDGHYGAQDVRRAVAELKAKNIHSYAITISNSSHENARAMFGVSTALCKTSDQLGDLLFSFFEGFIKNKVH